MFIAELNHMIISYTWHFADVSRISFLVDSNYSNVLFYATFYLSCPRSTTRTLLRGRTLHDCITVRISLRRARNGIYEAYKRQRKREATVKHSIAPGIRDVARRNLRKREVESKSERSRAGERERERRKEKETERKKEKERENRESGRSFLLRREKRRARTRQETDVRINNGYSRLLRLDSSPSAATVLRGSHERQSTSRAYVVFCIAPQRGRLMAAVMQRDCPFHGALRGKTHVATGETHANDTRTCTS